METDVQIAGVSRHFLNSTLHSPLFTLYTHSGQLGNHLSTFQL